MSTESFQFRYPLNRNPYVADQKNPVIYPYARFASLETSPYLYVYGRQVPFRSYFGEDLNLSARPITRTIQPSVLQYEPIVTPEMTCEDATVSLLPTLNDRFASLIPGQNVNDLRQWDKTNQGLTGAQIQEQQKSTRQMWINILVLILGVAGAYLVYHYFVAKKKE
jgi:hypothetical protein